MVLVAIRERELVCDNIASKSPTPTEYFNVKRKEGKEQNRNPNVGMERIILQN